MSRPKTILTGVFQQPAKDLGKDHRLVLNFRKGRYAARMAATAADIAGAQHLRTRTFRAGNRGGDLDIDAFDEICSHFLIEESRTGQLVCCFRILPLPDGGQIGRSYSAQHYELSALEGFSGRMAEMGRFCIDPDYASDPDILRVAWGAMAKFVDEQGIEMLFGCSSFAGVETRKYLDAFAILKERHLAPKQWLPRVKAQNVFRFGMRLRRKPDIKRGMLAMPPLLRSYLMMGGWVSDHAVVDHDMNTLHVFTGLEIAAMPPVRVKLLRGMAGR